MRRVFFYFALVSLLMACTKDRIYVIKPPDPSNPPTDTSGGGTPVIKLYINEFMASNNTAVMDPAGEYDDWLEIYNAGTTIVDLGGYSISDDLSNPTKYVIPTAQDETKIQPGGFLIIWCDSQTAQGPLHAGFNLSGGGESIALYRNDQSVVDSLTYTAQQSDLSFGRVPDGSPNWQTLTSPSPGASNQ